MLGLSFGKSEVEIDSRTLVKCMHRYGKERLRRVLYRSFHVLVVSKRGSRHDNPLRVETALETGLELVKPSLEENLLRQNFLAVQVNLAIVRLDRIWFFSARDSIFTYFRL